LTPKIKEKDHFAFAHMTYTSSQQKSRQPYQRRSGCGPGCLISGLISLVLLAILVSAVWLIFVRPSLHNLAYTQIDQALSGAVEQFELPEEAALLPPGQRLPLTETGFNNMIVLNLSPANPVQQPETHITPQEVRVDFQLYGYGCAIRFVPAVENARLVVTNVVIEGVVGLIMSPQELTPLLNKHLANAQSKLPHAITAVELRQQEMLLTLG